MDDQDDIMYDVAGGALAAVSVKASVNPASIVQLRNVITPDFKKNCPDASDFLKRMLESAEHLNSLKLKPSDLRDSRQSINQGLAITVILTSVRISPKNARTTILSGIIPPDLPIRSTVVDVTNKNNHLVYGCFDSKVECAAAIAYSQVKLTSQEIETLKKIERMEKNSRRENNLIPRELVLLYPGSRINLTHYVSDGSTVTELMAGHTKLARGMRVTFNGLQPMYFAEEGEPPSIFYHCSADIKLESLPTDCEAAYADVLRKLAPMRQNFYASTINSFAPLPYGLTWTPMYYQKEYAQPQQQQQQQQSSLGVTTAIVTEVDSDRTDVDKKPGQIVPVIQTVQPVIPINAPLLEQFASAARAAKMGGNTRFVFGELVAIVEDNQDWVYSKPAQGGSPPSTSPMARMQMACNVNDEDWILHFDIRSDVLACITGVVGAMAERISRFIAPHYSGPFPVSVKTQPGPMKLQSGAEVTAVTFYVNDVPLTPLADTITAAGLPMSRNSVLRSIMLMRRSDPADITAAIQSITEQNPLTKVISASRRPAVVNITQHSKFCTFSQYNMDALRATSQKSGAHLLEDLKHIRTQIEADPSSCQLLSLSPDDYNFYVVVDREKTPAITEWINTTNIDAVHNMLETLIVIRRVPADVPPCLTEIANVVKTNGKLEFQLFAVAKSAVSQPLGAITDASDLVIQMFQSAGDDGKGAKRALCNTEQDSADQDSDQETKKTAPGAPNSKHPVSRMANVAGSGPNKAQRALTFGQ